MPDPNDPTAHVMATPTEHGWGFIKVVPTTDDPEDHVLADYINQAQIPLPAPVDMLDALEAAIERFNARVKDASGAEHETLAAGASRGMPPGIPGPTLSSEEAVERIAQAAERMVDVALPDPTSTSPIEMPDLDPLAREYSEVEIRNMTLADKIRHYWTVIDTFTEQAVVSAESVLGPGTGDQKKDYVTHRVLGFLKRMEDRVNVIPDWIQPVVFHGFRFGLSMTIERVVKSFKARGTI